MALAMAVQLISMILPFLKDAEPELQIRFIDWMKHNRDILEMELPDAYYEIDRVSATDSLNDRAQLLVRLHERAASKADHQPAVDQDKPA